MTSRPAAARHLRDLALLRRIRDRIDREYAQPLDVEARQTGDQTGQESRSAAHEAVPSLIAMDMTTFERL